MNCLIISGMSGAGKSQAVDVLEDIGYYCVDNMPAALIPRFAELFRDSSAKFKKVAFVVDVRGDTDFQLLFTTLDEMRLVGIECKVLFLDCAEHELINRYKATRRRHPLDTFGKGLFQAVEEERARMEPVRERADHLINTTSLSTADLKRHMLNLFAEDGARKAMMVSINTFGFKYGIPHESDLVFDVRFLQNPFYVAELRDKTGNDKAVFDYVFDFPAAEVFAVKLRDMLEFLIPLYIREGKNSLVVSIGCTGGHHRSVSIARRLLHDLEVLGYDAMIRNRDIDKLL